MLPSKLRLDDRAVSPVLGTVLLVGLTVLAATVVGAAVLDGASATSTAPRQASLDLTVRGDTLVFVHRGGDALDVRALRLAVAVDGEPLSHQPPVPFFSAAGFRPGPTGPFNVAADHHWTAGEAATVRVAGSNDPALSPGATVTVEVFVEDRLLLSLTARVSG